VLCLLLVGRRMKTEKKKKKREREKRSSWKLFSQGWRQIGLAGCARQDFHCC
jgi:hypothetical protein